MGWVDADFQSDLVRALNAFDWSEVAVLCERIVSQIKSESTPIDEKFGKRLLYLLRRKRQFASMVQLSEAMLRSGLTTLQIRRQYAQALIDQGVFTPAELVLQAIVHETPDNNPENREARGLSGRIYKQLYVNNSDPLSPANRANLEHALKDYLYVYRINPQESWWHGINAVALLSRARLDGFPMTGHPEPEELAKEILAAIETKEDTSSEPLYTWDIATKVEAYVALGDTRNATITARTYVESSNADAFEIYSTLRQLQEVWRLKDTEPPGNLLLPVLRAAHLEKAGAMSKGDPKALKAEAEALEANMEGLEGVFGATGMQPYRWYKKGLDQCESIARIEGRDEQGIGTGWLVKAADFFPAEQGLLLLTNDHVISQTPNPRSLFPHECRVNFQATGEVLEVEEKVHWSSKYTELDATFLKLKKQPQLLPLELHKAPVRMNEPPPRMYIIGYPRGGDLKISLQDNYLLGCNDTLLHYRTPTEPGSSGSPVFESKAWEVAALHHKSNGKMKRIDGQEGHYQANEGISILRIQAEIAKTKNA